MHTVTPTVWVSSSVCVCVHYLCRIDCRKETTSKGAATARLRCCWMIYYVIFISARATTTTTMPFSALILFRQEFVDLHVKPISKESFNSHTHIFPLTRLPRTAFWSWRDWKVFFFKFFPYTMAPPAAASFWTCHFGGWWIPWVYRIYSTTYHRCCQCTFRLLRQTPQANNPLLHFILYNFEWGKGTLVFVYQKEHAIATRCYWQEEAGRKSAFLLLLIQVLIMTIFFLLVYKSKKIDSCRPPLRGNKTVWAKRKAVGTCSLAIYYCVVLSCTIDDDWPFYQSASHPHSPFFFSLDVAFRFFIFYCPILFLF